MKTLALLAAASAALCGAPAYAAASAGASFGPITLQLFDLNPLDGIAASITFNSFGNDNSTYASATQNFPYLTDSQSSSGDAPWAPSSSSATAGVAHATASITGSGSADGTTLSTSGSAGDFNTAFGGDLAQFVGSVKAPLNANAFTLSANTVVVFSGLASVFAAGTDAGDPSEYAAGQVVLGVTGLGGGGGGSQAANDTLGAGGYSSGGAFSYSDSRTLAVSFVNLSGAGLDGSLTIQADAYGFTSSSPVPEPGGAALMLAGLGAVGFLARRRR